MGTIPVRGQYPFFIVDCSDNAPYAFQMPAPAKRINKKVRTADDLKVLFISIAPTEQPFHYQLSTINYQLKKGSLTDKLSDDGLEVRCRVIMVI